MIQEELEKNGSPRAEFFTDEDRTAMKIRNPIHPAFLKYSSNKTNLEHSVNQDKKSLIEVLDGKATKKLTKKTKGKLYRLK